MAKQKNTVSPQRDDMRPEYDFSNGVRGKFATTFPKGSCVVVLDPDVAEVFPTQEAANEALRSLVQIIKRSKSPKPKGKAAKATLLSETV